MKTITALLLAVTLLAGAGRAEPLRVFGSSTVARAFQPATEEIFKETGADLAFETGAGSSVAIRAIAAGQVDLAMSTRALTSEERTSNPAFSLFDLEIGLQALVPIVSRETYAAGLRSVKKDDLIKLYEGDLPSWANAGGPALKPSFINPTENRGVWEPFVTWMYGNLNRVGPGRRWKSAATDEQARDLVGAQPGALSITAPRWVDGKTIFALAVVLPDGTTIEPTEANFRSRKWPLVRPIMLIASNKPAGLLRKVLEFMAGPRGQAYVAAADFLPRPEVVEELASHFR